VRRAALAGDGVDPLDVLGAQVVEDLADHADALVLANPRPQEAVQLLIGRVHQGAGGRQQADLVAGLDAPGLQEDLLAVDHLEAGGLEGGQHRHLDDVDAERLTGQAALLQLAADLAGDLLGDARRRVEGPAERGDAGAGAALLGLVRAALQPGVVDLVVTGRRPEVPDDRLAAARQQGEADELVHRPGADVGRGHVADVVEVEGEQRSQLGAPQGLLEPRQPLAP
jgi:hypothetical protein